MKMKMGDVLNYRDSQVSINPLAFPRSGALISARPKAKSLSMKTLIERG